jgi:two-component system chemotaxis response regulator CheY
MDILLVDDSRTMRMIVQRAIRQAGYRGLTVGEADNGAQALEKLRSEQPKLILSRTGTCLRCRESTFSSR